MNFRPSSLALAALAAAIASPAFAATTCADSTATIGNAGYLACQGPVSGNISPGQTNTATFSSVTYDLVGKSDDSGAGPFQPHVSFTNGATSGTLTFDAPVKGLFVLGLKGGPDYSLYLFDGGLTGITTLNWDTQGIVKGNNQPGPGLSHASLLTAITTVPEPESYGLVLAGLAGVGCFMRRKQAN